MTFDSLGLAQPDWNHPDAIEHALAAVRDAHDESASTDAYHRLLFAVGNNHGGTYHPVVLAVLPALFPLLTDGPTWPRHTLIEVLTDLVTGFAPEPDHQRVRLPDGTDADLSDELRRLVRTQLPALERLAAADGGRARGAHELIDALVGAEEVPEPLEPLARALAQVGSASDAPSSHRARNDFLSAVGNSHAGTYGPVVLDVLPGLFALLLDGPPWPRHAFVQVLVDLIASFSPDPEHALVLLPHGPHVSLPEELRRLVENQRVVLEYLAASDDLAAPSARELLAVLDAGPRY